MGGGKLCFPYTLQHKLFFALGPTLDTSQHFPNSISYFLCAQKKKPCLPVGKKFQKKEKFWWKAESKVLYQEPRDAAKIGKQWESTKGRQHQAQQQLIVPAELRE